MNKCFYVCAKSFLKIIHQYIYIYTNAKARWNTAIENCYCEGRMQSQWLDCCQKLQDTDGLYQGSQR